MTHQKFNLSASGNVLSFQKVQEGECFEFCGGWAAVIHETNNGYIAEIADPKNNIERFVFKTEVDAHWFTAQHIQLNQYCGSQNSSAKNKNDKDKKRRGYAEPVAYTIGVVYDSD